VGRQTVWQVRILGDARASAGKPLQEVAAFQPSGGRLTATMSPQWYTGAENRLYRVQIHAGGEPGKATFKWSRRNASIAARIRQYGPAQLHFDSAERFAADDWIEITDDRNELNGIPGEMRRIVSIDGSGSAVTLNAPLTGALSADSARATCWDQKGVGKAGVIPVPDGGRPVALEDGISVSFTTARGVFRPGDYWLILARAATRSIDPLHEAPPRGIHHHYAELALFTPPGKIVDRRKLKT